MLKIIFITLLISNSFSFKLKDLFETFTLPLNKVIGEGDDAIIIFEASTFRAYDNKKGNGDSFLEFFLNYGIGNEHDSKGNTGTISVRVNYFL
jgi:hypothetical protein